MSDIQEILRRIGKHWGAGWEGMFSPNWSEDDADPGYWLPKDDADAIVKAYAELQLALNPAMKSD